MEGTLKMEGFAAEDWVFPMESNSFLVPIEQFTYEKPEADFPYGWAFRNFLPGLLAGGYDGNAEPLEVRPGASGVSVTKGEPVCRVA